MGSRETKGRANEPALSEKAPPGGRLTGDEVTGEESGSARRESGRSLQTGTCT